MKVINFLRLRSEKENGALALILIFFIPLTFIFQNSIAITFSLLLFHPFYLAFGAWLPMVLSILELIVYYLLLRFLSRNFFLLLSGVSLIALSTTIIFFLAASNESDTFITVLPSLAHPIYSKSFAPKGYSLDFQHDRENLRLNYPEVFKIISSKEYSPEALGLIDGIFWGVLSVGIFLAFVIYKKYYQVNRKWILAVIIILGVTFAIPFKIVPATEKLDNSVLHYYKAATSLDECDDLYSLQELRPFAREECKINLALERADIKICATSTILTQCFQRYEKSFGRTTKNCENIFGARGPLSDSKKLESCTNRMVSQEFDPEEYPEILPR